MSRLDELVGWLEQRTGRTLTNKSTVTLTLKTIVTQYYMKGAWDGQVLHAGQPVSWKEDVFVSWDRALTPAATAVFRAEVLNRLGPFTLALQEAHVRGKADIRKSLTDEYGAADTYVRRFLRNSADDQLRGRQAEAMRHRYPTLAELDHEDPTVVAAEVTAVAVDLVVKKAKEGRPPPPPPGPDPYELAVQEACRQVDAWKQGTVLGLGSSRGPLAGPAATRPPQWDKAATAQTLQAKAQKLENWKRCRLEWGELVRLALVLGVPDDRWLPPTLRVLTDYIVGIGGEARKQISRRARRYVNGLGDGAVDDATGAALMATTIRFQRERWYVYVFADRQHLVSAMVVSILDLVDDPTVYPSVPEGEPVGQPMWSEQVMEWRHWRTYTKAETNDALKAAFIRAGLEVPQDLDNPPDLDAGDIGDLDVDADPDSGEGESVPDAPGDGEFSAGGGAPPDVWGDDPELTARAAERGADVLYVLADLTGLAAETVEYHGSGHPLLRGLDPYDATIAIDEVGRWLRTGYATRSARQLRQLLRANSEENGPAEDVSSAIAGLCEQDLIAAGLEPGLAHAGGALVKWALAKVGGLGPDPWGRP